MNKTLFFFLFFVVSFNSIAQQYENETMDDPYLPMPLSKKIKTASYKNATPTIITTQVNIDSEGFNLVDDAANEPSLAIDPNNPLRMVIGWRQFENIASNFRQAGMSYTEDGGITWQNIGPIEPENFRSDPVLDTDSDGNFYYNSLNSDYECHVFKTNELTDWSNKTFAQGGDKQWMAIDKTDQPSNGQIYAFWKEQFSACDGNFTRSFDEGASYEPCSNIPTNITRGTIAIDFNGDLYSTGGLFNSFRVLKSTNAKFLDEEVTWMQDIAVDLKGQLALYDGPNPSGMLGQVWITTDHSGIETNGNVYLLAPIERNDNNDPCDVMFSRSTDGGNTWSEATKINDDVSTSNWNWFPTMSVAPNGRIDMIWVDTRDNPGTYLSALYYSYSLDGGITWSTNEKLSESFDPHLGWPNQQKIGDYYHMISDNNGTHLAWSATFNGEQDVYYSNIIFDDNINVNEVINPPFQLSVFPNPAKDIFYVSYNLHKASEVSIVLYDALGKSIKIYLKNEIKVSGEHIETLNLSGIPAGCYIYKLIVNNKIKKSGAIVAE